MIETSWVLKNTKVFSSISKDVSEIMQIIVGEKGDNVNGVKSLVIVEIGQNQFDALVSFAYNCGICAFF